MCLRGCEEWGPTTNNFLCIMRMNIKDRSPSVVSLLQKSGFIMAK